MKKAGIVIGIVGILLLGIFLIAGNRGNPVANTTVIDADSILLYKGSTCGCCSLFSDYLGRKTNSKINALDVPDINVVKQKYNIPASMQSCHTTIIGDYFIEGHMPMEAISKLLQEKPNVAGIALPGMPSGSPGMPGAKTEPFVIYAVNKDGSTYEFMRM